MEAMVAPTATEDLIMVALIVMATDMVALIIMVMAVLMEVEGDVEEDVDLVGKFRTLFGIFINQREFFYALLRLMSIALRFIMEISRDKKEA